MKDALLKRKEELNNALRAHIDQRNKTQAQADQEVAQHNVLLGRLAEVEHQLKSLEESKPVEGELV